MKPCVPATLAWLAVSLVVASAPAAAQLGDNYQILHNGADGTLKGVGAGGNQTAADGIGTYIPGEDLRGSIGVDLDGKGPEEAVFSYRNVGFNESVCVETPGPDGFIQIRFPGVYFFELDGLDPNAPAVFSQPVCSTPLTASFVPYEVGPGSPFSFVAAEVAVFGPTHTVLLPDNGLVSGEGSATLVAAGAADIPGGPPGLPPGCYTVRFTWVGSGLPFLDGIDSLWHYAVNSPDGNQYWQMSTDELNLWQSNTVVTDGGAASIGVFSPVVDYAFLLTSAEATTHAILAPNGIHQDGPYYGQTEGMEGDGGPNGGFDVGRGSRAVSFSGLGGVKVPPGLGGLGNGAQDPAYNPGSVPTLGFLTLDNKPNSSLAAQGSQRVTWISVDLAQLDDLPPSPGVTEHGGTVRLPVETLGFPQPLTHRLMPVFVHETLSPPSGWPDPSGLPQGAFGVGLIAGGSVQVELASVAAQIPCNVGFPINLQYGSSGKSHIGVPRLTFDPQVADISGRRELYLLP